MSLFQTSMQEGRFDSKVDQRTTNGSPRRNGGRGQTRSRGSATSCARRFSSGNKKSNCVLRPTHGFRGVQVGEASHPGPVQTQNAKRLQSTQVDSELVTGALRLIQRTIHQSEAVDLLCRVTVMTVPTCMCVAPPPTPLMVQWD